MYVFRTAACIFFSIFLRSGLTSFFRLSDGTDGFR